MSPPVEAAIIAGGVGLVTVIATIATQVYGILRTSKDVLNARFGTAADKLGSEVPTIQLAGVYAMAGLADDWDEGRQTCVDVLCGYLRMPYEADPGKDAPIPERHAYRATREVRHTVIRIISAHLQYGADPSWQDLKFDFRGVIFDGGDFRGATFSGDTIRFENAEFSGGLVDFSDAEFSRGLVRFNGAKFAGSGVVFLNARFSGALVDFRDAKFSGGLVLFGATEFSGGEIEFDGAKFSGGTVNFGAAEFTGSKVTLSEAEFSGSVVDFINAEFSGGLVDFGTAEFSGGLVNLSAAHFCGGTVDLSRVRRRSSLSAFPWAGPPPAGLKLSREEDHQSQA